METKRGLLIIVLMVLAAVLFLTWFLWPENAVPVDPDDPSTFVNEEKGIMQIQSEQITEFRALDNELGQQYNDPSKGISTAFSAVGAYKGELFVGQYFINQKPVMKIGSDMDPSDGIIEGYFLFDIIDNQPTIRIFLDQDWKNALPETKILHGFLVGQLDPFDFNEISPGIYMDSIVDSPDNYADNYNTRFSRILVGDITQEVIDGNSTDVTMIVFQ